MKFKLWAVLIIGGALVVNGHCQSFLTNGLVAWYPFNGSATDASGNGNNGTVYGATLTTNQFGTSNSAYYFDGVSSYITTPLSNTVFSGDFTVSVWFKGYDWSNQSSTLLYEEDTSFFFLVNGAPGAKNLIAYAYTSTSEPFSWFLQPPSQIPLDIFSQGVITKQGTNITMYFNAVSAATGTAQDTNTPVGNFLTIGIETPVMSYTAFHGAIDDIRIYNRALSAVDVQQLYALESAPLPTPTQIGITAIPDTVPPTVELKYSSLTIGVDYQVQMSGDLTHWTNYGSPFSATATTMFEYLNVGPSNTFFRLAFVGGP